VVVAAATGRELVEKCREHQPDLIISDIRMPDMDGDVAIQQICSGRPTPFILISAYSKSSYSPDGAGAIGRAYLTKPIKRENLEDAIAQVCRATAEGV
jgi:YesN/AraC family two-component response regulator